jgi:nicotinamide riboside transporter PnuC
VDFLTVPQWFELFFSILGVVGVFLVSIKRKQGFIWIGLGQLLFVFYFYYFTQYFLAIQNIILFGFNIFGYVYWTRKEKTNESN